MKDALTLLPTCSATSDSPYTLNLEQQQGLLITPIHHHLSSSSSSCPHRLPHPPRPELWFEEKIRW